MSNMSNENMERNLSGTEGSAGGGSRFLGTCLGCFGGTIVAWLIIFLVLYSMSGSVAGWLLQSDLNDYLRVIEQSPIEEAQKKQLTDRVEAIKRMAKEGKGLGLFEWATYSIPIRDLIEDKKLTREEVAPFLKEMDRVEQAMEGKG